MNFTVSGIVSDETLSRIIDIESAGNPNAKAKTSSATGLAQFINATWLATLKEHRPDLFNGPPYDDELALRTDPALAIELLARLTEDNAAALGRSFTDGDLYLAHFAGIATARKLARARDDAAAETVFSAAQIKANRSILEGKTCGEVRAWAARKMARARTDWVAIHWQPVPLPKPRPQIPDESPAPDDPGHDPITDPDPVPAPIPPRRQPDDPGVPAASRWQRFKRWLGIGTGTGGAVGFVGYLTDTRVILAIVILIVVLVLVAFAASLWLFGKERVRDFISRLVHRWFL